MSKASNTPSGLDYRFEKCSCSKCGEQTYRVCYLGNRPVCVPCFRKTVEAWQEMDAARA